MKLGSLGQGRASTGQRRTHAQPGRLAEALLHPCALAGSHKRSWQRFPSRSRLFQHAGRCFATKINYMKAHTRSQTDVRCRMILNNRLITSGSVVARVQSLAGSFVEIRGYIEPGHQSKLRNSLRCLHRCCGKGGPTALDVRQRVIGQPSRAGRRSVALIHRWRPFGPRTRPNHSRRSRTHQSSVRATDHVATCTSTGGSTAWRSASPYWVGSRSCLSAPYPSAAKPSQHRNRGSQRAARGHHHPPSQPSPTLH